MFPHAEGTDELFLLFIKLKINNKHEVFITDDVMTNHDSSINKKVVIINICATEKLIFKFENVSFLCSANKHTTGLLLYHCKTL